jgi:acyl carrier protein
MGLDTVELVIEVEKTFDISILDADAEKFITVGQLYDCVLSKLPAQKAKRCLSAVAFYQFRSALTAQFGVDRSRVRPSTLITSIMPEPARRSEWQHLGRHLDWYLPSLVRPAWMTNSLMGLIKGWIVVVIVGSVWVHGLALSTAATALTVAFFGTPLLLLAANHFTVPFATRFPAECLTVREMVQAALALNYAKVSAGRAGGNQDVWDCLRAIIVKQLGVPADEVVPSAEFVRDFGAG